MKSENRNKAKPKLNQELDDLQELQVDEDYSDDFENNPKLEAHDAVTMNTFKPKTLSPASSKQQQRSHPATPPKSRKSIFKRLSAQRLGEGVGKTEQIEGNKAEPKEKCLSPTPKRADSHPDKAKSNNEKVRRS